MSIKEEYYDCIMQMVKNELYPRKARFFFYKNGCGLTEDQWRVHMKGLGITNDLETKVGFFTTECVCCNTEKIAEAMKKALSEVKKIIFVSGSPTNKEYAINHIKQINDFLSKRAKDVVYIRLNCC
ncbi:MAG TPA: hypothetical protein P5232_01950 [Candidatus Moranbacteria bacterium]|nr:hypothetical protein [Candidatus Moranbacteria bacterium]